MNRVPLPWNVGSHAKVPRDISDLLLLDVNSGICEKSSRVEELISAIQKFIYRSRTGLESGFNISPHLIQLWEGRFASFNIWKKCKSREIYKENWIDWEELEKARKVEAFRFLEQELRRARLTVPIPGGLEWWPNQRPPSNYIPVKLQASEPSKIKLFNTRPFPDGVPEGLGLLGTPERDARLSWLAPIVRDCSTDIIKFEHQPNNSQPNNSPGSTNQIVVPGEEEENENVKKLPFWIQLQYDLAHVLFV